VLRRGRVAGPEVEADLSVGYGVRRRIKNRAIGWLLGVLACV